MLMPSVVSAHEVAAAANAKVRASFDIRQAEAEADVSLHAPPFCVSGVFEIGSGDLTLPGKAMPAKKRSHSKETPT